MERLSLPASAYFAYSAVALAVSVAALPRCVFRGLDPSLSVVLSQASSPPIFHSPPHLTDLTRLTSKASKIFPNFSENFPLYPVKPET